MATLNDVVVSEQQKELCAVTTMRRMIESFADEKKISYEEALLSFAASETYKAIFDFETGIWREGPEYFRSLYEEELSREMSH